MIKVKFLKNKGFTLIEVMAYIVITALLLVAVSATVMSTMNARKHLRASEAIQHNARFILNFIANRVHNVSVVDVVSPAPEQILFYTSTSTRFSFTEESGNLLYRININTGGVWPLQASSTPLQVNSGDALLSNFVLTATDDNHGNLNRGILVNFTLTTGNPANAFSYKQEIFNTFISVR